MERKMIKDLQKGEFFKLKESSSVVWVRGYYERTERKYECYMFDDVNHESFMKGTREVFVGFEF